MQVHVFLWIAVCFTAAHGVMQYKVRGPPMASRPPHGMPPHYMKSKWPAPQRVPSRPYMRPIPVHMASYKVPVLARPPKTPAPLVFPSAVWKTPTAVYRPPVSVDKPFLTSPPVTQPYEYHLQKEPILNVQTIKQIGEKGPIHTIPAPNLSPADKPKVILEQPAQKHTYQYTKEPEISPNAISPHAFATGTLLGAQALPLVSGIPHQYQVTENAEPSEQLSQIPFTAQKTYYAPDPDQNGLIQKLSQFSELNNGQLYSKDVFVAPQQLSAAFGGQLSAQDLYQLLNGVPQQQLVDSYGMPLTQQPQLQQHFVQQAQAAPAPSYQALLHNPQLLQPESAYFNQIPDSVSQQVKDNFKPQFHTFNYVEQGSQTVPNKGYAQSRVTADYSLEPEASDSKNQAMQSSHDALAQTQYIQQYFATREDTNIDSDSNELEGNVPAEAQEESTRASQILSQLSAKKEISPSMFYSSLPNREAAETLATLQAAGSINSKSKQQTETNQNHREQMRIYVPDEEESYEDMETQASGENNENKAGNSQGIRIYETTYSKSNSGDKNEESVEYEDYSGEDESSKSDPTAKNQVTYGNKLKTKSENSR